MTDPAVNDRYISGRPPFSEATPDTPAQYLLTMTATDLDGASTGQTIGLTVMNVAQGPKALVTPASLAFTNQLVGTSSAAEVVMLTNEGESVLGVSSIDVTGADAGSFGYTTDCGATLAVAASCSVNVTFAPTTTGAQSATLSITTDAAGSPGLVSLDGTGIAPDLTLGPSSLVFGTQLVGRTTAPQALTLTNTGSAPLAINGLTLTGSDAAAFAHSSDCGASLAVAASCTVNVSFTPITTTNKLVAGLILDGFDVGGGSGGTRGYVG